MTEDRVAPRTAPRTEAGKRLRAALEDIGVRDPERGMIAEVEAEAASLDSDELRKAVEATLDRCWDTNDECRWCNATMDDYPHSNDCPVTVFGALLSAGDKAEAPSDE